MKFILKVLFAPIIAVLAGFIWLCALTLRMSAWALGIVSTILGILGLAVLLLVSVTNGIIVLVIAFLVSPVGLPMAAASGEHSYLYGWLLSSNLFWYAMAISVIPALFGKSKFSLVTTAAFVLGIIFGMIFGPYPEGAAIGHDHYGWAIWGGVYLLSILVGILAERFIKGDITTLFHKAKENK